MSRVFDSEKEIKELARIFHVFESIQEERLFYYRLMVASCYEGRLRITQTLAEIPLLNEFFDKELPNLEEFNEWAEQLEKQHKLTSLLRLTAGMLEVHNPPYTQNLYDPASSDYSEANQLLNALHVYDSSSQSEATEETEDLLKMSSRIPAQESQRRRKYKIEELEIFRVKTPLPESLFNDTHSLAQYLRKLVVANHGRIENAFLLWILDEKCHEDARIWLKKINQTIAPWKDFAWEIHSNAPQEVHENFKHGRPNSIIHTQAYYILTLTNWTDEERIYSKQLKKIMDFIQAIIAYFLVNNKTYETKENIIKVLDLDPESKLRPIVDLSKGLLKFANYNDEMGINFDRDAYEKALFEDGGQELTYKSASSDSSDRANMP